MHKPRAQPYPELHNPQEVFLSLKVPFETEMLQLHKYRRFKAPRAHLLGCQMWTISIPADHQAFTVFYVRDTRSQRVSSPAVQQTRSRLMKNQQL